MSGFLVCKGHLFSEVSSTLICIILSSKSASALSELLVFDIFVDILNKTVEGAWEGRMAQVVTGTHLNGRILSENFTTDMLD